MAINIYRWFVLVLSAPLELLKVPLLQRRYRKIKETYLQLSSISPWNRHALNATNSTSGGQLGVASSVERLGNSQLYSASLVESFTDEDTSGCWYMKCSDVFSRNIAEPLRWFPQTAHTFVPTRARATLGSIPQVTYPGYSLTVHLVAAITLYAGIALLFPLYDFVFNALKLAHLRLPEDIEAHLGLVLRSKHARLDLQLNYVIPHQKDDRKVKHGRIGGMAMPYELSVYVVRGRF